MPHILCPLCQSIFDDITLPKNWLQAKPLLGFEEAGLNPDVCHLCAIISAQHEQQQCILAVANSQNIQSNIFKIEYAFNLLNGFRSRCLVIFLRYSEKECTPIRLPVMTKQYLPERLQWKMNPSPETLSPASIQFLKEKLVNCLEKHTLCCKRSKKQTAWHPTRLIYLKRRNGRIIVTLVDGQKAGSSPYSTLSHCWGGHQPLQLNCREESSFRNGRPIDDFPKTFRDAMIVSLGLGVYYLWIDSLCIFQDSKNDKLQEISTMQDVYSHALCNIAATGAPNPTVGLSFSRHCRATLPFWVTTGERPRSKTEEIVRSERLVFPPGSSWFDAIEGGPLNQRAWVMQENLLSSRVLHFTQSQVIWECYDEQAAENYSNTPLNLDRDASYPFTYPLQRYSNKLRLGFPQAMQVHRKSSYHKLYVAWTMMLDAYTRCSLSDERDKLPAISGMVKLIESQIGDRYTAGFWHSRLPQDLLWMRALGYDGPTAATWRSETSHAPTWSWANVNFPIWSRGLHVHFDKIALASATVEDISSDKIPVLTLRGKLLPARLCQYQDRRPVMLEVENLVGEYPIPEGALSTFAYLDDPTIQYPYQSDIVCLKIYEYERKEDEENPIRVAGIILKPTSNLRERFERVGMFYVHELAYTFYKLNEAEQEVIVRVL